MTRRLVGGVVAGAFAMGMLTGSVGTVVFRAAGPPPASSTAPMADLMADQATGVCSVPTPSPTAALTSPPRP